MSSHTRGRRQIRAMEHAGTQVAAPNGGMRAASRWGMMRTEQPRDGPGSGP